MPNPSRDWIIENNRLSLQYKYGVREFIRAASQFPNNDFQYRCPCKTCNNVRWQNIGDISEHLLDKGFTPGYTEWYHHGEQRTYAEDDQVIVKTNRGSTSGLHDAVKDIRDDLDHDDLTEPTPSELRAEDEVDELFSELEAELYPGCKEFSSLSFLVSLMHLKVTNHWTNKSFTELLQLLKKSHPVPNRIPEKHYEAKAKLKRFGMGYEMINVCVNNCVLFRKDLENSDVCPVCSESRWKPNQNRVPQKVLRYFPLKDRLKRLYASKHTSIEMQWHEKERLKEDGVLRHPADGTAWQKLDERFPDFAAEPRNVRLGLAADGFNPFGEMSLSYSMWPVVLTAYNLPPWLCMKKEYLMLTLLIPGPRSPGKDIDVFLAPLVEELKELWEIGFRVRDGANDEVFRLRAALLWTINDFPARSYLSGWSGQGYLACPTCHVDTPALKVRNRIVYYDHRKYLPLRHRFRKSSDHYVDRYEKREVSDKLTPEEILAQLESIAPSTSGKRKRSECELNWSKKSIFYELPYWLEMELKHNIDVMHVEKNVCENLLGTILSLEKKNYDTEKARRDLMDLNIKRSLHLERKNNGYYKPPAAYVLTPDQRQRFTDFLRSVKFPDGLAGNLKKNVTADGKLTSLKSHDCHVILQRLLALGIRPFMPKAVHDTITELCNFFKMISSRTLRCEDLERARTAIIEIMCKLEMIFPPAFFTIMLHVSIHLPEEALCGGPVHMRWMYPFERYLGTLKHYVRNRARPEGSIAEAYVVEEALTFVARYLEDKKAVEEVKEREISVFRSSCVPYGMAIPYILTEDESEQAEWYIYTNCDELEPYLIEHLELLQQNSPDSEDAIIEAQHRKEFKDWFRNKIYCMKSNGEDVSEELYALSLGPKHVTSKYPGCFVNGVKFITHRRDNQRITQNSGICVPVDDDFTFYGRMQDVIVMNYTHNCQIYLFKCIWYGDKHNRGRIIHKDNTSGATSSYTAKEWFQNEPFILASQAKQVFYIQDLVKGDDWQIVQECNHRGIWDIPEVDPTTSASVPLSIDLSNIERLTYRNESAIAELVTIDDDDEEASDESDRDI